ncbi:MAG: T9SS type A sorting domain-containing protein, partial [Bacteroidetes bacterium]|nr:T9SS type A sorting domain-containing protein [Bacteroidota bacterium]
DSTTLIGDAYISGEAEPTTWTAIRGGFGATVSATMEEALIVRGKLELVGSGIDRWSPLRYGFFDHQDIGTLTNQYTDSAKWGYIRYAETDSAEFYSNEADAFGYLLSNRTGSNEVIGGSAGTSGNVWAVNGGSWISTYGADSRGLGNSEQAPRRAAMPEGKYDFAMSAMPLADGTTEVRWYLVSDDGISYWQADTVIDTTGQKADFNGFVFSVQGGTEGQEGLTGINLTEVEVDRGAPIEIPEAPFSAFYVEDFGFLGGAFGSAVGDTAWALTPGEFIGDVAISGDAATGWAAVGGNFGAAVDGGDAALRVAGKLALAGGGFEDDNSLRFGLFNKSFGGRDSTQTAGYVFSGDSSATGYLFLPPNGTAGAPAWTTGTGHLGGVAGGGWFDPMGPGAYGLTEVSSTGTPSAGDYLFEISAKQTGDGGMDIRYKLWKSDNSYMMEAAAVDANPGAMAFNGIAFGTNNSTTTGLTIEELYVDRGEVLSITGVDDRDSNLPTEFSLEQNYPNPFNTRTTIKFALPETENVRIDVYNLLGQRVATLLDKSMQAGYHDATLEAQGLSSGMYIYRIEA